MVSNFDTQIEILLFDQEKLVTYKELNNRFDITPNEAQELLAKFVDKKRKEDPKKKFYVTYLVIGIDNETKCKRINLVNENDLDTIEKECKILSKKVYSIQNIKIEDFNLLYSNDIDSSNNVKRKANLTVSYCEKSPTNLMDQVANVVAVKSEPDLAKLNLNKTGENKPKPVEANKKSSSDLHKHKEDHSHQKENIKGSIKDEPMDTSETAAKKTKTIEETKPAAKPSAPASKPAAKQPAKQPAKQQATLTSFFKKA